MHYSTMATPWRARAAEANLTYAAHEVHIKTPQNGG